MLNSRLIAAFMLPMFGVLVAFGLSKPTQAHPFQYSTVNTVLTAQDKNIILHTEVSQALAADQNLTPIYEEHFQQSIEVSVKGKPCAFKLYSQKLDDSKTKSIFDGQFNCENSFENIEDLSIKNKLFIINFENLDHFLTVKSGEKSWDLIFKPSNQDYPGNVTASEAKNSYNNVLSVAKEFIVSGIEHIWKGYDHLLFLLSAILLLRRIKRILLVVTAFTVAHSITLTLAALDIITLSPRLVEPLIALSILYIAVRNLLILRKKEDDAELSTRERWITTFGFGLIHGLGFASVLKEADIPNQYFAWSLGFFNLGIEAGQLAVLLIFVPLLLLIDKSAKRRLVLIVLSSLTAVTALIFFVQRIIG